MAGLRFLTARNAAATAVVEATRGDSTPLARKKQAKETHDRHQVVKKAHGGEPLDYPVIDGKVPCRPHLAASLYYERFRHDDSLLFPFADASVSMFRSCRDRGGWDAPFRPPLRRGEGRIIQLHPLFEAVIIGCRAFRGRERFDDPIEKSAPRLMEPLQGERVSFFDKDSGDAEARRRPPHSRFLR